MLNTQQYLCGVPYNLPMDGHCLLITCILTDRVQTCKARKCHFWGKKIIYILKDVFFLVFSCTNDYKSQSIQMSFATNSVCNLHGKDFELQPRYWGALYWWPQRRVDSTLWGGYKILSQEKFKYCMLGFCSHVREQWSKRSMNGSVPRHQHCGLCFGHGRRTWVKQIKLLIAQSF